MYQALYRKYRPKTFDDIAGQDIILKTIKNSILTNKISHAYIFTGPRGSGKTSIAKIFAKTVNCQNIKDGVACDKCVFCTQKSNENMDIIEIDAASNNGVDEIREINNKVNLVPSLGKYKVYIIDEVHMLTIGAFNALLKTLEEPPAHIIFILATTDPQKVPMTILSRCQRFDFKKIEPSKVVERLQYVVEQEKIDIEESAINSIAQLCDGSLRDALSMLDQVITYSDKKITVQDVHDVNGTVTKEELTAMLEHIINGDISSVLNELDKYSNNGKNIPKIAEELIFLIRNVILSAINKDKKYDEIFKITSTEELLNYITVLDDALSNMKKSINPKMILELSFIKIYSKGMGNEKIEKLSENIENSSESKVNELGNQKKLNERENDSKPKTLENKGIISQEIIIEEKNDKKSEFEVALENFKKIRIENILSSFSKQKTLEIKKKMDKLEDLLLDDKIGTYVEMLLDGEIKAVGEHGIIFVYSTVALAETFNENIKQLEKILKTKMGIDLKVISTDIEDWNSIKEKFNSKKIQFEYKEETSTIDSILKIKEKKDGNFNNLFGELLEYN